ncbi:MAG TPA: hypothetical protein DD407_01480 [Pseudohongiella sp.]|nr:hypothetical protein [Pseudohongiella sp.]
MTVKTIVYNQTLETQDLVNLIAHMKENPVREGILLNHLRVHSLSLLELTYADANMLIERVGDAG